jgi:flavodoxin
MKTLVVYFSKFGNTHQIADAIAGALVNNGDVRTLEFNQLEVDDLKNLDLLVMGSPTHNMNLPKPLKPILEQLPKRSLPATPAAVFDTSYKMSWMLNRFTASKRLAKKVRKMGGKLIVKPEIFLVTERKGPLYEGEAERAKEWTRSILQKMINNS